MLAYADNIVILGDAENDLVKATEEIIKPSHRINLAINKNKTPSND